MDSNYLVQRKINAQKKYRKKITLIVALCAILFVLIMIGLIKVILDEKKAEKGTGTTNKVAENLTPGIVTGTPEKEDSNSGEGQKAEPGAQENNSSSSVNETAVTTAPTATATPAPVPVVSKKVAIDPGHGGDIDLGSVRAGLHEKNANLAIALFLKEELISRGYEVFMIRETDEAVENKERPAMALESGADIYVSVHLNSLDEDSDATRGTEVWYSDLKNDESSILAQYVVDELTAVTGSRNRGIKLGNNLTVLLRNELPACLVECGFMSSETERTLLFDPEYQKKIANGIANGIEKFLPLE